MLFVSLGKVEKMEVTLKRSIITVGGRIIFAAGEKVEVVEKNMKPGYWSKLCPDIWVAPRVESVNVVSKTGETRNLPPECFVEAEMLSKVEEPESA